MTFGFRKIGEHNGFPIWRCVFCAGSNYFTTETIVGGKITGLINCRVCNHEDTGDEY